MTIKEGKVEAYAAFDRSCCGVLTLCGLWVGDPNPAALYSLLKTVILRAQELYSPQTRIALQALLQGKKFSNSAKALLHQMGHRV